MPGPIDKPSAQEMTFLEHLDSLRPHLLRGAAALLVASAAAFLCKGFVVDTLLMGPQSPDFPTNRFFAWLSDVAGAAELKINGSPINIINTSLGGQFGLHLSVSLWAGMSIALPYILWELWRFVSPALTPGERKGSNKAVMYISLCFFTGLAFGYFVIAPVSVDFLAGYVVSDSITNMIDVGSYLYTVLTVSMACGFVFLLPLLVWFLARMGIVTAPMMRRYRRHAIILLAVLSAAITPPDLFSMILVGLPLYLLYEYGIVIAERVGKRRRMG